MTGSSRKNCSGRWMAANGTAVVRRDGPGVPSFSWVWKTPVHASSSQRLMRTKLTTRNPSWLMISEVHVDRAPGVAQEQGEAGQRQGQQPQRHHHHHRGRRAVASDSTEKGPYAISTAGRPGHEQRPPEGRQEQAASELVRHDVEYVPPAHHPE